MKKIYILLILASIAFAGCYSDTVNSFETFTFQFPVAFTADYINRSVPRTTVDFSNLYKYDEFNKNKSKISKAQIIQMNYWIDSLVLDDGSAFDPAVNDLEFGFVRYTLKFARPKYGNEYSLDSIDFEPDPSKPDFELGSFDNVKVSEFYRNPKHILSVPEDKALVISELLKEKPYFYIVTEYSAIKGQAQPEIFFPLIRSRFDVMIRFEVKL